MSPEMKNQLDAALLHVKSSRRDLLKRLLLGGGAIAVMAPVVNILAAGKSNAEISKCINYGDAHGDAGAGGVVHAKVTGNGVATLTGHIDPTFNLATLTKAAQRCGATKVNNLVTNGKMIKGKPKNPPKYIGK